MQCNRWDNCGRSLPPHWLNIWVGMKVAAVKKMPLKLSDSSWRMNDLIWYCRLFCELNYPSTGTKLEVEQIRKWNIIRCSWYFSYFCVFLWNYQKNGTGLKVEQNWKWHIIICTGYFRISARSSEKSRIFQKRFDHENICDNISIGIPKKYAPMSDGNDSAQECINIHWNISFLTLHVHQCLQLRCHFTPVFMLY